MKRILIVAILAIAIVVPSLVVGQLTAQAMTPAPLFLSSIWTNTETGGQVQVTSYVDPSLTEYRYEVTNLNYDPPGGESNYGAYRFAAGNGNRPEIHLEGAQLSNSLGWVALPDYTQSIMAWGERSGLFPGQTGEFSIVLSEPRQPFIAGGRVSSDWRQGSVWIHGTYFAEGPLLFPSPLNQSPDCLAVAPSVSKIWPANHKFVSIDVLGITDPDGDSISIAINSIFQDEPVNSNGDGNTDPDGQGVGTATAQVRAERDGGGNGRVYHITFTAEDGNGGSCSGEVLAEVPHDKKDTSVDDGPLYDSTAP